jgi:hypothetical protein
MTTKPTHLIFYEFDHLNNEWIRRNTIIITKEATEREYSTDVVFSNKPTIVIKDPSYDNWTGRLIIYNVGKEPNMKETMFKAKARQH